MRKKRLFGIVLAIIISVSIMVSCKNASEQISVAFLRTNEAELACVFR